MANSIEGGRYSHDVRPCVGDNVISAAGRLACVRDTNHYGATLEILEGPNKGLVVWQVYNDLRVSYR